MNKRKFKYIGYYSTPDITPVRFIPLAGRNKMDYTLTVLNRIFDDIELISPACILSGQRGCKSSKTTIGRNTRLKLFSMLPNKCRLAAYANFIFVRVKLLFYLLKNIEKNEPVMVYHSLALVNTVLLAKKIKKFKMILELNELYSDVSGSQAARRTELKMIEAADAFIFSNEQLSDILNHNNRPYAVEYGIYTPEKRIAERFDDGKIHVVYAGTFDPTKGGAMAAAASAAYLPENYHVHIRLTYRLFLTVNSATQLHSIKNKPRKLLPMPSWR